MPLPLNQQLENLRKRDGVRRPPQPLSGLLDQFRKSKAFKGVSRLERLRQTWEVAASEVLGPTGAAETWVRNQASGELRVECSSPALARELATFRAKELLAALNAHLGGKDRMVRIKITAGQKRAEST